LTVHPDSTELGEAPLIEKVPSELVITDKRLVAPVPLNVTVFPPRPAPLDDMVSFPDTVTLAPQGTEVGEIAFSVSVVAVAVELVVADEVFDGELVPIPLIAETRYVYVVPEASPISEYVVDVEPVFGTMVDQLLPPLDDLSIMYPVIGEPPLSVGAVHERLICDEDEAVTVKPVGGCGIALQSFMPGFPVTEFPVIVPPQNSLMVPELAMVPSLVRVPPELMAIVEPVLTTSVTPDGIVRVPELMVSPVLPPSAMVLPDFMLKVPVLLNDPV
jgi:hypothetical protein